jgi:hypothetical protein
MADTTDNIALVREAAPITSATELNRLLDEAALRRPVSWVRDLEETRLQYEGHVQELLKQAVRQRYQGTGARMPLMPFEWVSLVAFKGSTIYDTPTTRQLMRGGESVDEETPAAQAFQQMIDESQIESLMPEFDRVRYVSKSAVLYVYSDSVAAMVSKKPPKTKAMIVWPTDLYPIVNPAAPTNLQACTRLLWRTGQASGSSDTSYMDWRRSTTMDTNGNIIAYGPWQADLVVITRKARAWGRVDESVRVTPVWAPYPFTRLPFVVAHKREPTASPFATGAGAIKDVANSINTSIASELLTVDMTAAPVLVKKSSRPSPASTVLGPGIMVTLLPEESLESVTQTSDLAGIRTTNAAMLENLALTERQRPGSFTGNDGAESGVALKIKSLPAEKARREDKMRMRSFEEEELLPTMIEIHDYFRQTRIAAAHDRVSVDFPDPPDFESRPERQTRLAEAVNEGWIDKARAAVEAGYYATLEEAKVEIARLATEKEARMSSALMGSNAISERSDDGDSASQDAAGTSGDANADDELA